MISEKIKAIAITTIALCLSEGISKLVSFKKVSRLAENSVINFLKFYIILVEGFKVDL